MTLEKQIQQKAAALGIHKCGIIRAEAMADYADRLKERMERIPNGEQLYGYFLRFADIRKDIPWAKSIIVLISHYGHYVLPEKSLTARYGKSYFVDARFNPDSPERQSIMAFDEYLHELGIRTAWNEHPGITAMRWAAYKAGLGIIRRNNFFYTEKGSWVWGTALATDREMELIETHSLPKCPAGCDRCIKACPTKSLSKPYMMDMATCVSRLTTSNSAAAYDDTKSRQIGARMYGCDICQDVCPMNKDKWEQTDVFPGLSDLERFLSPAAVLDLSYAEIEDHLAAKFFYIKKESLWRWKLNAINALVNDYTDGGEALIKNALNDEYEIVREKAKWALGKITAKQNIIS
jgi:epoxyqueuosine reductase